MRGGWWDAFHRRWSRLPLLLRAVVQGSFVNGMGTAPWAVLSTVNLQVWPTIPWSVPPVALYLFFYWSYLRGRWGPAVTAEGRRTGLRAHPLPAGVWRWALMAGFLAWTAVLAARVLFDAVVRAPAEQFPPHSPLTIVWYVLVTSAVAGIAEEAGFRGYMQGPIERRHGPVVAILIAGVVFWLSHFASFVGHVGWFLGYAWYYLAAAVVFGALAHVTNSILPGVVMHILANLLGFGMLLWWGSSSGPGSAGGMSRDTVLWTAGVLALVSAPAGVWAYRRLGRECRDGTARTPSAAAM